MMVKSAAPTAATVCNALGEAFLVLFTVLVAAYCTEYSLWVADAS